MIKVINTHEQSQILGINPRTVGHVDRNALCVWGNWLVELNGDEKPAEPDEPAPKRKRRAKADTEAEQ